MMLAPSEAQRATSSAISWGESGTCGVIAFVGTIPVGARLMISGSARSAMLDIIGTARAAPTCRRPESAGLLVTRHRAIQSILRAAARRERRRLIATGGTCQ